MQLRNPFPQEVRLLYLYRYECCLCGSNGNGRGGLELHHILGRISDSAFNSSMLCRVCHDGVLKTIEGSQEVFSKSVKVLHLLGFRPGEKDLQFLREYYQELVNKETEIWLQNM